MSLAPLAVVVLASTLLQAPTQTATSSGHLRWVRGVVTVVTPEILTLQLQDTSIALTLAPSTQGARGIAPGAVVDAHYIDRDDTRRAVLVIAAGSQDAARLSKRPGRSYRGIVSRAKRSTLTMRVDSRTRHVDLGSKTTLTDREGRAVVTGAKAVVSAIAAGEDVLVTYEEESNDMQVGDLFLPGSSQRAVEIRRMK